MPFLPMEYKDGDTDEKKYVDRINYNLIPFQENISVTLEFLSFWLKYMYKDVTRGQFLKDTSASLNKLFPFFVLKQG